MVTVRGLIVAILLVSVMGCSAIRAPADNARIITASKTPSITKTRRALLSLPPPQTPIVAAVYKLRDQSGQYKPSPSNSFSTAVTQGITAILSKAMLDSGWFVLVERESLQNLLTERKIIRANEKDGSKKLQTLPPAQIIIEGGVVAYDSNVRTGGAGARFLGLGGSTKYREDQVTVNLRAVNVVNGRIVQSVYSVKKIYSRQHDTGVFSYVSVDKLLELEAGYSYNEPAQFCVMDAIESALIHLIASGIQDGTWKLRNPEEIDSPIFRQYLSRAM